MPSEIPRKILIVDDEEEALVHLSNILKRADFEVFTANCGKVALELAKNLLPNLIILDIVLPDIPGDEVANILSEDSATADIPIIFLTGILTREEEPPTKKTGKYYVIAKPISGKDIIEMINDVLSSP